MRGREKTHRRLLCSDSWAVQPPPPPPPGSGHLTSLSPSFGFSVITLHIFQIHLVLWSPLYLFLLSSQGTSLKQRHRISALENVSWIVTGSDISCVRKLRPSQRATHTLEYSNTVGTILQIEFSFRDPSIPHFTPFYSFPGYTYNLPGVLDPTCIFWLFSFLHTFPMKILLFPLSDVTRGP